MKLKYIKFKLKKILINNTYTKPNKNTHKNKMADLAEFIDNEELSTIIMNAIPAKYKKTCEWEFTIEYENKKIEMLEVWKTKHRYNKDKVTIDLTKILTDTQLKQLFLTVIIKFDSNVFDSE